MTTWITNSCSRAVRHHTDLPWIILYVQRWLTAPVQHPDGHLENRTKGSPQGSVVSPLLANLFLHYAFDAWMQRTYPQVRFERYADDVVIHAATQAQAASLLEAVRDRLSQCSLQVHPEKTKIVYCQDSDRHDTHDHIQFDFLGYTFRPRRAKNRWGKPFVSFLPAVSNKAAKKLRATIREWRSRCHSQQSVAGRNRSFRQSLRARLGQLLRAVLPLCVDPHPQATGACPGLLGTQETQAVSRSSASGDPLVGSCGATRAEAAVSMADRYSTRDWTIRAG